MPQTSRNAWIEWMPALATLAGLLVTVATIGGYREKVDEHDRAITELKAKAEKIDTIDIRTTRIETKVDLLLPDKQQGAR